MYAKRICCGKTKKNIKLLELVTIQTYYFHLHTLHVCWIQRRKEQSPNLSMHMYGTRRQTHMQHHNAKMAPVIME